MDRIVDYFRSPSTGNGISGRTISLRRHSDDTEIVTTTTDANGKFSFDMADIGFDEGPVYYAVDDGSGTYKRHSTNSYGRIGPVWWDAVVRMFSKFGKGVMDGYEVSADGSGMSVSVSAGEALTKDGIPVYSDSAQTVTITAADGSNPRIDRIVLRTTRIGQTEEGKVELIAVAGTPAASPTAPSLTASSSTDDITLAQVLVDAGAAVIAAGKVTDERTLAGQEVLTVPLPVSSLDGVTATAAEINTLDGITATVTELNYTDGVTSAIQTQLDAKADAAGETFTGNVRVESNTVSTFRAAKGTTNADMLFSIGHNGAIPSVGVWNSGEFRGYSDAAATTTYILNAATGNAQFDGDLDVDGALDVAGAATFTGNVTLGTSVALDTTEVSSHFKISSGAFSVSTGAAAGTGGSLAASRTRGGDQCGEISVVTGASGTSTGVLASITFQFARPDDSYQVFLQPVSINAADLGLITQSETTTGFDIRATVAPGTGETLNIGFLLIEV